MKRKFIILMLTIFMIPYLLAGCDENLKSSEVNMSETDESTNTDNTGIDDYSAVLYDNAGEWLDAEFLKENLTFGAYYEGEYINDESYPKSKTFVIKEQDEFNEIFSDFPPGIDFENEMILIYIFTSTNIRPSEIQSINLINTTLKLEFKINKSLAPDATVPFQRCFVVKMDKCDVTGAVAGAIV